MNGRGTIIICESCKKETPKRANGPQKYCVECSAKKDQERKNKWNRANLRPENENREYKAKRRILSNKKGLEINRGLRRSISAIDDEEVDLNRIVRVVVPFDYGFSKNSIYGTGKGGHVFLRKEHRRLRDLLTYKIKLGSSGEEWYEDKVWLDIFVEKPNHQGDAVNVVDAVCDAVKEAIGVDDNWFSIRKLDWQIVKEDPRLVVGIGQSSTSHKRVCSYCGRILTLDHFNKNKSDKKLGVARECKECRNAKRRKK